MIPAKTILVSSRLRAVTLLIQSPWGKRSGAHMNPAITLAFLRLKRIHPWGALFFILAQSIGGTLGVLVVVILGRRLFIDPPVRYAVTMPGSTGEVVAFFSLVEGPLSGASMNPARSLASAVAGMMWQHVWIYLLAPTLGMFIAAQRHLYSRAAYGCAKLLHPPNVRCIHCNY
jgi:aquaporin Z